MGCGLAIISLGISRGENMEKYGVPLDSLEHPENPMHPNNPNNKEATNGNSHGNKTCSKQNKDPEKDDGQEVHARHVISGGEQSEPGTH